MRVDEKYTFDYYSNAHSVAQAEAHEAEALNETTNKTADWARPLGSSGANTIRPP